jgi:hypothetical protein
MKNHSWRLVAIVAILGMAFFIASSGVLAQDLEIVEITHPTEGLTVSGLITLTGTVDFPDFLKYEVFLQTDGGLVWAATVHAPVINGNLARLDTKAYPDGFYRVIIRTVKTDSNYSEYMGPSFLIENNLGAPLPPEIESSFLYPPEAGALVRIKNCSGDNLEFDYHSAQGFCSADNLLIEFKDQYSPICPYVDLLLIPSCEYQGTARGIGSPEGVGYTLAAEKGKIYELIYVGDRQLYLAEIPGDERASTDTGGLDREDPARSQSLTEAASAPADVSESAPPAADTSDTTEGEASEDTEAMLPVSGQGRASNPSFIAVAIGLILFLVVAGVIAMRKRGHPATD